MTTAKQSSELNELLLIKNVSYSVGNNHILKNVTMSLSTNEVVTIIGPNGAGKSTLLKLILGFIKRGYSGTIERASNLIIGYMPQTISLTSYMPLKVKKFLEYAAKDSYVFESVINDVRLESLLESMLYEISGGERQRVLFARALMKNPNLLVLDEPIQGLDYPLQGEFYELLHSVIQKINCSVLMVSHDLHTVMAGTNHVICLNKNICCSGLPAHVCDHPEFKTLFGTDLSHQFAIYQHNHASKGDVDD